MFVADSEQSDLRSRLAAAETARDECERQYQAKVNDVLAEMDRYDALRAGIQALADEARQVLWPAANGYPSGWTIDPASLRSLLSPANPQKGEADD